MFKNVFLFWGDLLPLSLFALVDPGGVGILGSGSRSTTGEALIISPPLGQWLPSTPLLCFPLTLVDRPCVVTLPAGVGLDG